MSRFKSLKPGQSPDPQVNALLEGARDGWWKDTSMFGIIARQPILLKTIVPVFEAFFGKVNFDKLPLNEALAVQLAEYIAGDPNYIPDGFFERLATVYTDEEIIELVFACSIFNWGNKFNITMQVDGSEESTYTKGMVYPGADIRAASAVTA